MKDTYIQILLIVSVIILIISLFYKSQVKEGFQTQDIVPGAPLGRWSSRRSDIPTMPVNYNSPTIHAFPGRVKRIIEGDMYKPNTSGWAFSPINSAGIDYTDYFNKLQIYANTVKNDTFNIFPISSSTKSPSVVANQNQFGYYLLINGTRQPCQTFYKEGISHVLLLNPPTNLTNMLLKQEDITVSAYTVSTQDKKISITSQSPLEQVMQSESTPITMRFSIDPDDSSREIFGWSGSPSVLKPIAPNLSTNTPIETDVFLVSWSVSDTNAKVTPVSPSPNTFTTKQMTSADVSFSAPGNYSVVCELRTGESSPPLLTATAQVSILTRRVAGQLGYPSADGSLRLFSAQECVTVGGQPGQGDTCAIGSTNLSSAYSFLNTVSSPSITISPESTTVDMPDTESSPTTIAFSLDKNDTISAMQTGLQQGVIKPTWTIKRTQPPSPPPITPKQNVTNTENSITFYSPGSYMVSCGIFMQGSQVSLYTATASVNIPTRRVPGQVGYPSEDNYLRLYNTEECTSLKGSLRQGDLCFQGNINLSQKNGYLNFPVTNPPRPLNPTTDKITIKASETNVLPESEVTETPITFDLIPNGSLAKLLKKEGGDYSLPKFSDPNAVLTDDVLSESSWLNDAFTIEWSVKPSATIEDSDSQFKKNIIFDTPGVYTVTCTLTSNYGTSVTLTDTQTITIKTRRKNPTDCGYPSKDGSIRLFNKVECEKNLKGILSENGECLKKQKPGSYSWNLSWLNTYKGTLQGSNCSPIPIDPSSTLAPAVVMTPSIPSLSCGTDTINLKANIVEQRVDTEVAPVTFYVWLRKTLRSDDATTKIFGAGDSWAMPMRNGQPAFIFNWTSSPEGALFDSADDDYSQKKVIITPLTQNFPVTYTITLSIASSDNPTKICVKESVKLKLISNRTPGEFGYPSKDGSLRLFSRAECTQLGGKFTNLGECMAKTGGSYSTTLSAANKPTMGVLLQQMIPMTSSQRIDIVESLQKNMNKMIPTLQKQATTATTESQKKKIQQAITDLQTKYTIAQGFAQVLNGIKAGFADYSSQFKTNFSSIFDRGHRGILTPSDLL